MATKRISQLDTIADALVTGGYSAYCYIRPLIPNRKAKVNQLFRGLSAGSQTALGWLDLDRDSGIYQSAVNEIGLTFGTAAFYNTRRENTDGSSTLVVRAVDTASATSSIEFTPQGSGFFTVNGPIIQTDAQFFLGGDQNPAKRAQFNVDTISTQSGTRRFDLPNVVQTQAQRCLQTIHSRLLLTRQLLSRTVSYKSQVLHQLIRLLS